jgi:hypothetical protein
MITETASYQQKSAHGRTTRKIGSSEQRRRRCPPYPAWNWLIREGKFYRRSSAPTFDPTNAPKGASLIALGKPVALRPGLTVRLAWPSVILPENDGSQEPPHLGADRIPAPDDMAVAFADHPDAAVLVELEVEIDVAAKVQRLDLASGVGDRVGHHRGIGGRCVECLVVQLRGQPQRGDAQALGRKRMDRTLVCHSLPRRYEARPDRLEPDVDNLRATGAGAFGRAANRDDLDMALAIRSTGGRIR